MTDEMFSFKAQVRNWAEILNRIVKLSILIP